MILWIKQKLKLTKELFLSFHKKGSYEDPANFTTRNLLSSISEINEKSFQLFLGIFFKKFNILAA